ncbi:hypothetical protein SERLA73DRAFT_63949, partial [Serpula lacrymans var. lacrymans S7.3]
GRQLFKNFPIFRDTVVQLDDCYKRKTGVSFISRTGLFDDVTLQGMLPSTWPISVILPSIAMVQIAMFDLLSSFGLCPDILIGHSAGETSLLYASGAGPKEMAMEIAIARGQAMTLLEGSNGTMAALACSSKEAQSIIDLVTTASDQKECTLEIACFNAPEAVTISGHTIMIDRAIDVAVSRGILARKIRTRVAVHSSMMEMCKEEYHTSISQVFARYPGAHRPQITTYSTCNGRILDSFTEDYFWENTIGPVLFTSAAEAIIHTHPNALFVEISAHPALSSYLIQLGASSVTCPMRRTKVLVDHHDHITLLNTIGHLIISGINDVNFSTLNREQSYCPRIEVPLYPFLKKPVPYLPDNSRVLKKQMGPRNGPLIV